MNPERYNTKKLITFAIVIGFFLLFLWLLYWLVNHGRIAIKLPSSTVSVEVYNQTDGEQVLATTLTKQDLNKILRSGKYEVRLFSDGGRASTYFITVPSLFRETSVEASLVNQHNRTKLARNTERCLLYSRTKLYSHSCSNSPNLYSHQLTTGSSFSQRNETSVGATLSIQPFGNDQIALYIQRQDELDNANIAPSLAVIKNGSFTQTINLPANFYSEQADYSLAIDKKNGGIVVGRDKNTELLFFEKITSQPKIIKPNTETRVDASFLESTIDIHEGKIYYFLGKSSASPDSEEETEKTSVKQNTIIKIFDASSQRLELTTETNIPNNQGSYCGESTVCFLDQNQLDILSVSKDGLIPLLSIGNISDYTSDKEGVVYYIQNNTVNQLSLKNQVSRLIFKSRNFQPSTITMSNSGLLLNALLNSDKSTLHAFIISNEPSRENSFFDDYLPYEQGKLGVVQDSDFSSSTFLVKLALTSWESNTPGSTDFTFDSKEFNSKRKLVTDEFNKDINNRGLRLVVIP